MAQLTLITVGSLKEKYLADAVNEYKKRLSAYARVDTVELSEAPIRDEDDRTAIAAALRTEGEKILSRLTRDAYKVALCVEGDMLSSEGLARMIGDGMAHTGKLTLVIGSSYGLSPEVKAACDARLSLSRLTMPHQLARVVTLEAVYRAFTILAGKRYHK